MNKRTKITALLFALCLVLLTFSSYTNIISKQNNQYHLLETTSNHMLTLFGNTHYNRPIYANYSVVNFTLLFQSSEINSSSHVYIHYSHDLLNWTTYELQKTQHLTDYSAFYDISLGPFPYEGEYYISFNATQGITELANGYLRIDVEKVIGIVFVDFSYRVKLQDNITQYADLFINVLGDDIKLGSVFVASDQQQEGEEPLKLNLVTGSNHTYKTTIGPINSWKDFINLSFNASTSDDTLYMNNDFFFYKPKVSQPEDFWRSRFPAIIVSVLVVGTMMFIYFMAKRKPPRSI